MIWIVLVLFFGSVLWLINFMHNRINDLCERIERLQDENANLNAKLSQRIDNLKHSNDEVNPSRYASKREFDKEKLKIEQVRMDLRDFMEICTGEIFDEEDSKKVYNWKWYKRTVLDDDNDYY